MVDVTGAEIRVPDQLADLPLQIQTTSSNIEGLLQDLNSKLVALQAFWQGPASDGHGTVQGNWHTAETNLLGGVGVLGNIGRTAQINWDNYVDCENSNTKSWTMS